MIGDSLLKEVENSLCRADPLMEACCFPEEQVKDGASKLPTLVWPSDCYPLLISQVVSDEVTGRNLRAVMGYFGALR